MSFPGDSAEGFSSLEKIRPWMASVAQVQPSISTGAMLTTVHTGADT